MVTTRRQSARPQAPAAALERQPTAVPPFTIGALRKAIPAHCFKRSLLKSSAYLAVDLLMAALLYLASTRIDGAPVPTWCKFGILWPLYWFFQGAVCTGLWVIAHECGHQVSASLFCRLARVGHRGTGARMRTRSPFSRPSPRARPSTTAWAWSCTRAC